MSALASCGYGSAASWGRSVKKIDPGYLLGMGASLYPLWKLADVQWFDVASVLTTARDATRSAIYEGNLYVPSLRQARALGREFVRVLEQVLQRVETPEWDMVISEPEVQAVHDALLAFQSAYITELRNAAIYYVEPHSGFDIEQLIDNGICLFPKSLISKVPDAERDVRDGAKALAYRLWTASGYHFHRANEAVLRAYFDHVAAGVVQRQPKATMGKLVEKMKEKNLGKRAIWSALFNIIEFHRNPLIHPEDHIDDEDEAVSLYTAIRSAMGYMLNELPGAAPPPTIAPPPLILSPQP
jgi:hypothetical protein